MSDLDLSDLFNKIVKKVSTETKEAFKDIKAEATKGFNEAKVSIDKQVNKQNYTKKESFTFEKYIASVGEITPEKMQNPMETAALLVNVLTIYNPENQEPFFAMISKLMGEAQELTPLLKQSINDRMKDNNKWEYIGKSYFMGATNLNDYTPQAPLTVEVIAGPYSYDEDGFAKLFLHSGGADSDRPVTFRKMKDGRWVLWSDSILGLLAGIRKPESENPWA